MKHLITALLALLLVSEVYAHQLIVKVKGSPSRSNISRSIQKYNLKHFAVLSGEFRLLIVDVPNVVNSRAVGNLIQNLQREPAFEYVVYDRKVRRRATSRAPFSVRNLLKSQWSLIDKKFATSAVKAWKEFGVGGKDLAGQDVVVAIVDEGVLLSHPGLKRNAWVNRREVPGNGVDDDNNGYIDDINGWNPGRNNGKVRPGDHGTHVAGIVAGNDPQTGFKGIAPNTKIMTIDYSAGDFISTVVKAYTYVYSQKKTWFRSTRTAGTNVIATNSSFGVDGAKCGSSQYKLWAEMYDKMGRLGILSAAATTNNNWNVDKTGDVPTACPSPFIVAVGNIGENGRRSGGYGHRHVDLHAQGTQILSTVLGNKYSAFSGTSMATPHVAGAISYLYSVSGREFQKQYRIKPAKAAMFIKEAIMKGAIPAQSLSRKSVTGGYLNLYNSAKLLRQYAGRMRRMSDLEAENDLQELLMEEPLSL